MRYEVTVRNYGGSSTFEIEAKSLDEAHRLAKEEAQKHLVDVTGIRPVGASAKQW